MPLQMGMCAYDICVCVQVLVYAHIYRKGHVYEYVYVHVHLHVFSMIPHKYIQKRMVPRFVKAT